MEQRIVLAGDSVFDNAAYVAAGCCFASVARNARSVKAVASQVRHEIRDRSELTLRPSFAKEP